MLHDPGTRYTSAHQTCERGLLMFMMFETSEWRVQYVGLISNDSESTVKQIKNCCKKLVYLILRLDLKIVKHC